MNNKEAIEILESFVAEGSFNEVEDALALAISALRALEPDETEAQHCARSADDDRSAVTFWLPRTAARREQLARLFEHAALAVRQARPETGLDHDDPLPEMSGKNE